MGISIKRAETEHLARQLAEVTGESLTDAIHHALEAQIAKFSVAPKDEAQLKADQARLFAWLDSQGPGNGKSLAQIEADMYGDFGEPI